MSRILGYNYTEDGKPVPARKRFSSTEAVYALYEEYRRYDVIEEKRRARILAIYNKNRPYRPEDLEAAGQKWRTNINFGELSNAVDARAGAVNRIAFENCNLITLTSPVPQFAGPEDEQAQTIVEEEFSDAIRQDGRVVSALALMNKETDLYGCGPVTWRDPEDYVPEALKRGQVLFDPEGPIRSSDHEIIMIDTVIEAASLFRMLDNPKFAEDAGWNVEGLKKWVVRVFSEEVDSRSDTSAVGGVGPIESYLETLQRNDFYEAHQFDKFHVLYVYVREMKAPRKITHIILPATSQYQDVDTRIKEGTFLYMRENAFDTMDDVFYWQVPDMSKHYIRSARGIASDVAPKSAAKDRLSCAMVDSAMRALSLVVKQTQPSANPSLSLQETGPYTIIGQEFEAVPNGNQMSNFQGVISVQQMLEQTSVGSLAGTAFGPTMPKLTTGGTQISKAEGEIIEKHQRQRDENFMAARLEAHRKVWAGTFARFMKIAIGPDVICKEYPYVQRFKERCEKRGVDKKTLKAVLDTFQVDVSREIVLGMDGLTQFITSIFSQFGGNADEAGRKRMSHDVVRYQLGRKLADRYFPIESRDNGPSNDASIATLENNAIRAGQTVLVGPDQRQYTHIRIHMEVLQEIQETVENGLAEAQREWQEEGRMQQSAEGDLAPKLENPEELMRVLVATSQHVQEHMQILALQPNTEKTVAQIDKTLRALGDTTQSLNLAIATARRVREAEEEKRQRELDELRKAADEAEIQKAQHKMDLEAQNQRRKIELDHELALERLRMEGATTRARLGMEAGDMRMKHALAVEGARRDAALKGRAAAEDSARKNLKLRSDLERDQVAAEGEARVQAADIAATRAANYRRLKQVTGRGQPRPSDFTSRAAGGIPL